MAKKKKKPKKPKYFIGAILLPFVFSSCATFGVVRKEIIPSLKDTVIAAGPNLAKALLEDVASWLAKPMEWSEKLLGDLGISEQEKPPEAPAQ